MQLSPHAQSILKLGFALTKKKREGGGGRVSARDTEHMAAALAGCRTVFSLEIANQVVQRCKLP